VLLDGIKNVDKRRPHGLLGLREAEYRQAHPGQHQRRGGNASRFEHAVKIWERVLTQPEVTEYDISPWDALLLNVRVAAARVGWTDQKLREATTAAGDNVLTDLTVRRWQQESRNERRLLGQLARDAIQAGVQERLVRQIELEGQLLADVLTSTLQAIPGLDARWFQYLLEVAQARLLTTGQDAQVVAPLSDSAALPAPPTPPEVPVQLPRLSSPGDPLFP
jgi:hypothetical protein